MSGASGEPALQEFFKYPFETDEVYKQGLAGIVDSSVFQDKSKEEQEEVHLRSRVFYFQKVTGTVVDIEDVRRCRASESISQHTSNQPIPNASREEEQPTTLTFAQLKELIEQGKTDQIPNNRTIPNDLHTGSPSVSTATVRLKPWEKQAQTESTTSE
ncbi:hypothetical protein NLI96_g268 [Meripilus lineatus]|uniref:Uncharacterized protein n=1 Tax=Meripilus lineatus TaxID=2056292 RepID=A0AAD5VF31_9APHY|nr:hypothetical protein NLI96_g268 [Physisporinus lineatus]